MNENQKPEGRTHEEIVADVYNKVMAQPNVQDQNADGVAMMNFATRLKMDLRLGMEATRA
jgi:hypothetical protein